jgi:hypothetical protein
MNPHILTAKFTPPGTELLISGRPPLPAVRSHPGPAAYEPVEHRYPLDALGATQRMVNWLTL